jgi:hypothetical protein
MALKASAKKFIARPKSSFGLCTLRRSPFASSCSACEPMNLAFDLYSDFFSMTRRCFLAIDQGWTDVYRQLQGSSGRCLDATRSQGAAAGVLY